MPRATPLPADERRAALIAATEPLLDRYGRRVSTRRIAEAAGVAEGTIFRVFPTKEALIDAVFETVVDLDQVCAELGRIDRSAVLEERLAEAVAIMQRRLRRIFALFHALRPDRHGPHDLAQHRARQQADNARLNAELAELVAPEESRLRMPAAEAANLLRTVTMAMTHPLLGDPQAHDPDQIVDLVLHGITHHPQQGTPC